jgi:hypothetical protein
MMQMSQFFSQRQENLMSFVDGELEMADDFMEDASVYLQLRHFFSAVESLQNASEAMNIAEWHLSQIMEKSHLLRYQCNIRTARERLHTLEQSIPQ